VTLLLKREAFASCLERDVTNERTVQFVAVATMLGAEETFVEPCERFGSA
jgi:hypothetical protein